MDAKLSEEQIKCLQAPWRFSLRAAGFEDRLLTSLQLFERFPLDITVTGGTHEANAQLACAVCGLDGEQEIEKENDEDEEKEKEDDEEEDDDDDEGEEEDGDDEEEENLEDVQQPPKEANAQLACAVCGLDGEQEIGKENDEYEEKEDDEEEDDDDEGEEEDYDDEEEENLEEDVLQPPKDHQNSRRKHVRIAEDSEYIGWSIPDFDSMLSHTRIPNVRVRMVHGHPISNSIIKTNSRLYDSTHFDVLVVLTTEERKEDHMWLNMELRDRDKPFYLVKAKQVWDVVEEKPSGPCMTCAWERMRARNLELQRRRKEAFGETTELTDIQSPSNDSDGMEMVEMNDIGEVLAKALPDLKKKAFSQFMVAITKELRVPKFIADETQVVVSTALKFGKINHDDLDQISKLSHPRDVTDHPSKLLTILTALDGFILDIGVLGETGCGSSSLVNAILGMKNDEEQAAPTGVIETTKEVTEYPYPEFPKTRLLDLPGIGRIGDLSSQSSQVSSFGESQPVASVLALCDVYILVSPLRLRLGIMQLMQQLSSLGKECYLVLSMADLIEEKCVVQVREWAEGILGELDLQQNLFLVSSHHPESLDFPKLKETLDKALPKHKKVALARYAAKLLDQDTFWKRSDSCKFM